jgi:hypothetical protein
MFRRNTSPLWSRWRACQACLQKGRHYFPFCKPQVHRLSSGSARKHSSRWFLEVYQNYICSTWTPSTSIASLILNSIRTDVKIEQFPMWHSVVWLNGTNVTVRMKHSLVFTHLPSMSSGMAVLKTYTVNLQGAYWSYQGLSYSVSPSILPS